MSESAGAGDEPVVAIGPRSGLTYVNLHRRWADELEALEFASFPTARREDLYSADDFRDLADDFPEGCFVGLDDGEPVALGCGVSSTHSGVACDRSRLRDAEIRPCGAAAGKERRV